MSVRLWPTLPKDFELNGFLALERPLLDDPEGPYFIIAEVNRRRFNYDDDTADTTPTIRVLHGEALLGDLSKVARDLLREAKEARCGKPRPAPEPQPPMFDGSGEHLGEPGSGAGDEMPGDEVPGDGDPGDADGGEAVSPRFLSAVPDGSPDGE